MPHRRSVTAIGIGQCVNWGVLYYAFGVLLLPVERELGTPRWVVAGAFSVALLTSAAAAPAIGRWVDRGYGPALMAGGGLGGAALLAAWAALSNVWSLYLSWSLLGLCMAAALYEPAFAIVGRAIEHPADRLRSLAGITVLGGLASTIFLPLTAVLVQQVGWRRAVWWLAALMALTTAVVSYAAFRSAARLPSVPKRRADRTMEQLSAERSAFRLRGTCGSLRRDSPKLARHSPRAEAVEADRSAGQSNRGPAPCPSELRRLIVVFSCGSLAASAFTTNLVPALVERGLSSTGAATLGGLFGLMQIPGRALIMQGRLSGHPARLLVMGLLLQAAGFAVLVVARSPLVIGPGVALFGLGAGLNTLVRPYLVQTLYGIGEAGYLNGVIARGQQLARAGGPAVAAGLFAVGGYGLVFGLFAAMLAALAFRPTGHSTVDIM